MNRKWRQPEMPNKERNPDNKSSQCNNTGNTRLQSFPVILGGLGKRTSATWFR